MFAQITDGTCTQREERVVLRVVVLKSPC